MRSAGYLGWGILFLWVMMPVTPLPAQPPPPTRLSTSLAVVVEGRTLHLPATLKSQRRPAGRPYNTDLRLDVDLRRLYARLPQLITGIKRSGAAQTVTIANVRCRYAEGRILVRSTADYRQALTSSLALTQTLHSTIALHPVFEDGVLRLAYEVRDAAFEGLTQGLLTATGTDPRSVVRMIFDRYFKEDLSYPLPAAYRQVPLQKKELRLFARDGKFFGLRAAASARLSQEQYETLLRTYF
ncbi:MAG: hypothetical protein QNJ22_09000 [Desulfosarcinaceae bacterium]|nr:hypothetical protein [Desulfosarcinaceae bacterium]